MDSIKLGFLFINIGEWFGFYEAGRMCCSKPFINIGEWFGLYEAGRMCYSKPY